MTDTATTSTRNPWVYRLTAAGAILYLVAIVVAIVPPAHTATVGGDVVNFPTMFAQYLGVLMLTILATGLIIAGTITAAQDWARRN